MDETFKAEAEKFQSMLTAALTTGRLLAYPGKLDGDTDVIVFGYLVDEFPKINIDPLFICVTDEIVPRLLAETRTAGWRAPS